MSDQIVRGMTADGYVKVVGITTTETVETARQMHRLLPMATAALGRVLTAASMMGNMQKTEDGSVTLQFKGGGPLGTVLAVSDWEGNVRGFVDNPAVDLIERYPGKLDVGAAVGNDGMLTVIRDLRMKEPYIGSVPLVSGEIAEDIASYYVHSEQIPTACALGVLLNPDQSVQTAGGYLIQILPGAPDHIIDQIEQSIEAIGNVTSILASGATAEDMLQMLFVGMDLRILETTPIEYRCYCSRERVEATLISLGTEELEQIVRDQETVTVSCQFCDTDHVFTPENVQELLEKLK